MTILILVSDRVQSFSCMFRPQMRCKGRSVTEYCFTKMTGNQILQMRCFNVRSHVAFLSLRFITQFTKPHPIFPFHHVFNPSIKDFVSH